MVVVVVVGAHDMLNGFLLVWPNCNYFYYFFVFHIQFSFCSSSSTPLFTYACTHTSIFPSLSSFTVAHTYCWCKYAESILFFYLFFFFAKFKCCNEEPLFSLRLFLLSPFVFHGMPWSGVHALRQNALTHNLIGNRGEGGGRERGIRFFSFSLLKLEIRKVQLLIITFYSSLSPPFIWVSVLLVEAVVRERERAAALSISSSFLPLYDTHTRLFMFCLFFWTATGRPSCIFAWQLILPIRQLLSYRPAYNSREARREMQLIGPPSPHLSLSTSAVFLFEFHYHL